jgi:pimeloyl-ACP methyl ester carboxylesterase
MPEEHYPAIPINQGDRTVAIISKQPPERLVVFVHGFNGEALSTWNDFPQLVREDPDLSTTDFVFYGYDSVRMRATSSAARLTTFMAAITDPARHGKYPVRDAKGTWNSYSSILLVCHSLGAVVARRAMLMANESAPRADWVDRSGLLLFAPAHTGASAVGLANELPGYAKLITLLARNRMPVLEDLSEGCTTLARLLADSESAFNGGHGFVVAKKVVNAAVERVVHDHRFLRDPVPPTVVERKNHSAVCKPKRPGYMLPMEVLKEVL